MTENSPKLPDKPPVAVENPEPAPPESEIKEQEKSDKKAEKEAKKAAKKAEKEAKGKPKSKLEMNEKIQIKAHGRK